MATKMADEHIQLNIPAENVNPDHKASSKWYRGPAVIKTDLSICFKKWTRNTVLLSVNALLLLTILIILIVCIVVPSREHQIHVFQSSNTTSTIKTTDTETTTSATNTTSSSMETSTAQPLSGCPIVTRSEWNAESSKQNLKTLTQPISRVVILHTETDFCHTRETCIQQIRWLQARHMNVDSLDDIAYNLLFGGDGNVYEGRGSERMGAFIKGQNAVSLGIAFVGNYQDTAPTKQQMDSFEGFLNCAINNGIILKDFKLFGALQLQTTSSPGRLLYEELKKNTHWSDDLS